MSNLFSDYVRKGNPTFQIGDIHFAVSDHAVDRSHERSKSVFTVKNLATMIAKGAAFFPTKAGEEKIFVMRLPEPVIYQSNECELVYVVAAPITHKTWVVVTCCFTSSKLMRRSGIGMRCNQRFVFQHKTNV